MSSIVFVPSQIMYSFDGRAQTIPNGVNGSGRRGAVLQCGLLEPNNTSGSPSALESHRRLPNPTVEVIEWRFVRLEIIGMAKRFGRSRRFLDHMRGTGHIFHANDGKYTMHNPYELKGANKTRKFSNRLVRNHGSGSYRNWKSLSNPTRMCLLRWAISWRKRNSLFYWSGPLDEYLHMDTGSTNMLVFDLIQPKRAPLASVLNVPLQNGTITVSGWKHSHNIL